MWTDFNGSFTVHVCHKFLLVINSSETVYSRCGVWRILHLVGFLGFFPLLLRAMDEFTEHLYSSVFFLNESKFMMNPTQACQDWGLHLFMHIIKSKIKGHLFSLPSTAWFKGERRELSVCVRIIWRSESHRFFFCLQPSFIFYLKTN